MVWLLWDMYQQSLIAGVDARSSEASSTAHQAKSKAGEIERRIDALILTNMAMWSILAERLGVTDKDLLERMTEIDLSDGRLDGKARLTAAAAACSDCGKPLSKRHPKCFYCGAANTNAQPFGRAT